MKSRLDTHPVSFSLSEHSAHTPTSELPSESVSGGGVWAVEKLIDGVAAIQPPTRGVARQTWVHDQDVLELRYVN